FFDGSKLYLSILPNYVCVIPIDINADCSDYFIWCCSSCHLRNRHITSASNCYLFDLVFWGKWCNIKKKQENWSYYSKGCRCVTYLYWYIGHTYLLVIEV